MKPAQFEYAAPTTLEAAIKAIAQSGGDGKILAGGQSLVPMLNFRLLRPSILIDINRVAELAYIRDDDAMIRIGALTKHREVETSELIGRHLPVLQEAVRHVAHLAIRNRGTFGGSLSHADPAAELPMMALLLDAALEIASPAGRRTLAAADFFLGALTTALHSDDILVEIAIPKMAQGTGWAFEEVSRRAGDFALASVAVTLTRRLESIVAVRIGMMGIGEIPMRAFSAEQLLAGRSWSARAVADALAAIRDAVEPNSDLHASSEYRRHLVGVLAERALNTAWSRAAETANA